MARFVEVLEIERVVPDLVDRGPVEGLGADLELDDEHHGLDDQHYVDTTTDAGDVELEVDGAGEALQLRTQNLNLLLPGDDLLARRFSRIG